MTALRGCQFTQSNVRTDPDIALFPRVFEDVAGKLARWRTFTPVHDTPMVHNTPSTSFPQQSLSVAPVSVPVPFPCTKVR
jgi:hypothetical protein